MALFRLGPDWEKIAESTDDRFTAQCQSGYGMRVAFGAAPDESVLGLLVAVGQAVTRQHGAGDVYARAAEPPPGRPARVAMIEVHG